MAKSSDQVIVFYLKAVKQLRTRMANVGDAPRPPWFDGCATLGARVWTQDLPKEGHGVGFKHSCFRYDSLCLAYYNFSPPFSRTVQELLDSFYIHTVAPDRFGETQPRCRS